MDSATARGMTKLGCYGYFGKGGRQGEMDSATARGMAKFGFCAYSKNEALSFAWAEGGLTSLVNSLIQLLSGIN